ncbi:hypothetical protein EUTSA_v10023820mg, partial [Eutrema salsugineum]
MINDFRVCLMSINLHGISNLLKVEVYKVFHCEGFLLCITKNLRLVVWNPYLEQARWIQGRSNYHKFDNYFIGYDDINKNQKILRLLGGYRAFEFEIYNFKSNSWRVLVINPNWMMYYYQQGVSLKRNTYFNAHGRLVVEDYFLLCFDFTRERFGPRLHLPFHSLVCHDSVILPSCRENQLTVLLKREDTYEIEIWITTMIEPNAVSWSKFFVVNDERIWSHLGYIEDGSFFIDENKKVG